VLDFIGSHVSEYYARKGEQVVVFDNLSRAEIFRMNRRVALYNWEYLKKNYPTITLIEGDVKNLEDVEKAAKDADAIIHAAAQVAVTTSVKDPRTDFETNILGTFNVLEAARKAKTNPTILYCSCYDEKTRAVTKRGLKSYDELEIGDIVLSINPKTGKIEEKAVKDIIVQPYSGLMIHFYGKRIDLCVTPNHRMLIQRGSKLSFDRADNVMKKAGAQWKLPKGWWEGLKHDSISINQKDLPWNAKRMKCSVSTPDLFYLVGLYIGDGYSQHQIKERKSETGLSRGEYLSKCRDKTGRFTSIKGSGGVTKCASHIIFYFIPKDDPCRGKLERVLSRNGIKYHHGRSKAHGEWGVYFSSIPLFRILKQCGTSAREKIIPPWMLEYDEKHLRHLFTGLIDSDGYWGENPRFTTSSATLVRDMIELGVKIGYSVYIHTAKREARIEGRRVEGSTYNLTFSSTLKGLSLRHKNVIPYHGVVWCVEVEDNENLLVERNGKIAFSGNTNKVYGTRVNDIPLREGETRYNFADARYREGIPEDFPIDLCEHTPYGCSKLAGDLYVQDYAHTYGLKTGVFRMSCLAGDAEVSTPQGMIKIREAKDNRIQVYCFRESLGIDVKETKGSFETLGQGKKLYRVRTKGGYAIKATEDHRFFTPAGYLPLRDIPFGSLVAICPEIYYQGNRYTSKLPKKVVLSKEKFAEHIKKYQRTEKSNLEYIENLVHRNLLPLLYNNEDIYLIARLVGYLTGDGHLYHRIKNDGKSYTEIQVYALKDEIEGIKEAFRKLGFSPGKTRISSSKSKMFTGHIISGTTHRFSLTTTDAFAFFELLGVPAGNKSEIKFEVPMWIRRGPQAIQNEYLRGLFGAEMSSPSFYCRRGSLKSELQPLQFSQSKNKELAKNAKTFRRQLAKMLEKRGIAIRTYESKFFYKKGGEKSICFYLLVKPSKENFMKFAKIGYGFNKERNLKLYRIIEFMKTGLQYRHYDDWEQEHTYLLENSSLIWDRITYKKEIPMENIYDITVPGHHNFLANGFLVHNCIYGERQFGVEDQGWVAWFIIATLTGKPITIYGNGKQVRDVLHVSDLVLAYDAFINSRLKHEVFNIGGGAENTLSLVELLAMLEEATGRRTKITFADLRPGDQKIYISDISKAQKCLGWKPKVSPRKGVQNLIEWVRQNIELFK